MSLVSPWAANGMNTVYMFMLSTSCTHRLFFSWSPNPLFRAYYKQNQNQICRNCQLLVSKHMEKITLHAYIFGTKKGAQWISHALRHLPPARHGLHSDLYTCSAINRPYSFVHNEFEACGIDQSICPLSKFVLWIDCNMFIFILCQLLLRRWKAQI